MAEDNDPVEGLAATEPGPPPGTPRRRGSRAAAVAGAALIVLLVVAVPFALPSSQPSASPSGAPAASAPSADASSGTPGASPGGASPTPGPAAWERLDLPPLEPVAELVADDVDGAGPDPGTTFTLHSLTSTPAAALAAGLGVEPAIDLAIEPGPDPSRVVVRPALALDRGGTYRFTLAEPDGSFAGGWAFRTAAPPRIVGTIPGDSTTRVPVDTGIELTFDRDGVADPTPWFSIEPPAAGRFERHGRTWVFVPEALEPSTLYTATLHAGVPIEDSTLALEDEVRIRFETDGPRTTRPVSISVGRRVVEVAPGERPVVGVFVTSDGEVRPPASIVVEVHRLAGLDAAIEAARALTDAPTWAAHPRDAVDVSGLPLAVRAKVRVVLDRGDGYAGALRFPVALEPGWYVADLPDDVAAAEQVLLQVTPVAAYAAAARDRTAVWVNRVGGGPITNAGVRVADGPILGRTGADGLLLAATPAGTFPAPDAPDPWSSPHPILVVEAAGIGASIVPLGLESSGGYAGQTWNPGARPDASASWWASIATDRSVFRGTDSAAVWGVVRDRATGRAPSSVRLSLEPSGDGSGPWDGDGSSPAVWRSDIAPSASGVFSTTMDFADLPLGSYQLHLSVDGRTLATTWLEVGVVRKPGYRIDVSTDRRAYMAGDTVTVTATVAFYDGTPVPGLPIRFDVSEIAPGSSDDAANTGPLATTGPDGRAVVQLAAGSSGGIDAAPARPELGEVTGRSPELVVFPASVYASVTSADLTNEGIRVAGRVDGVDLPTVEASIAADREWTERVGPPAAGAIVRVTAEATAWVPVRSGTAYDFILRKTVPTYTYEERELAAVSAETRAGADGRFAVDIALPPDALTAGVNVQVKASATDATGRVASDVSYADRSMPQTDSREVWFDRGGTTCGQATQHYAIGEMIRLTLHDTDGPLAAGGGRRFLFITAQDGIRDANVGPRPTFVRRFGIEESPSFDVLGVAFDGTTYRFTTFGLRVAIDPESQRIAVTVSPDRPGGSVYRPGDVATVRITTADLAGSPVSAEVVVRAVDEKLYDAGVAADDDPVWSLYGPIDGAIVATYASHQVPIRSDGPGCGSTGGGGGGGGGATREDFRDRILFRQVRTGPDGTASVTMDLSDDLTAWHVAAVAVTDDLRVGTATVLVPVGLPFFVEPVAPDTVLAADRPSIVLRAYGSALRAGDVVHYTVRAPTLLPEPVTVDVAAFGSPSVSLAPAGAAGPLPIGVHRIVVEGIADTPSGEVRDAKVVTVEVVASRLTARRTEVVAVGAGTGLPGATGALTTCTFADAGRGALVPMLETIAATTGPRADQQAAAATAADILVTSFGHDPASLPSRAFDPATFTYASDGVALLPYGTADLEVTALAALGAPDRFRRATLEQYLGTVAAARDEARDRRIVALAGLAALDAPVLDEIRAAAAATDLSDSERVWLAVAAAEAGDLPTATALERGILAERGERAGGWARVRTGATAHDAIEATALLAIAAAEIGDPVAADLEAYVLGEQDDEAVHPLEEVAYAARALERLPRTSARFAYTLDGSRRVEDLAAGRSVTLTLAPAQLAAITVEPVSGAVSAACAWDEAVPAGALPNGPSVTVVRRVTPSGPVPAGSLVTIELTVTMDALAPVGLYRVTETLPAGLAPTGSLVAPPPSDDEPLEDALAPWSTVGNRAEWGLWRSTDKRTFVLRTFGRVVAPGTYAWEPAVVELVGAPSIGASTAATTVTILAP